jgi:hypothetical protein
MGKLNEKMNKVMFGEIVKEYGSIGQTNHQGHTIDYSLFLADKGGEKLLFLKKVEQRPKHPWKHYYEFNKADIEQMGKVFRDALNRI